MVPALDEEAALDDTVRTVHRIASKTLGETPEIIIFNDGSTDRTPEIADELAREIPGVRVVHHAKPMGVGYCFREALQMAKGERFTGFAGDNNVAPRLIEGRSDNIKVTRPEDLEWLRLRWVNR